MIWSTYAVFGSGAHSTVTFARVGMSVAAVVAACRRLDLLAVDDGHNGFVGTRSVPTEAAEAEGIRRYGQFDPGPDDAPTRIGGFVRCSWFVRHMAEFSAIDPSVSIDTLEAITARVDNFQEVADSLRRRLRLMGKPPNLVGWDEAGVWQCQAAN